ncbi:hypothetical protein DL89DRAFT_271276 [Linderina pennispora]|uniref:Uncharacterized protein n=1 Tax=Linderina pennispora TaxID=61395 RepID=A0A1Y1VV80_9FUNG|nr:uncharacterized protein DL89DRAFT_271276 [Linderina pennispora]ORX65199.1 hypothetical protein DL89DRAFT_271276 [Linderina pennispora]
MDIKVPCVHNFPLRGLDPSLFELIFKEDITNPEELDSFISDRYPNHPFYYVVSGYIINRNGSRVGTNYIRNIYTGEMLKDPLLDKMVKYIGLDENKFLRLNNFLTSFGRNNNSSHSYIIFIPEDSSWTDHTCSMVIQTYKTLDFDVINEKAVKTFNEFQDFLTGDFYFIYQDIDRYYISSYTGLHLNISEKRLEKAILMNMLEDSGFESIIKLEGFHNENNIEEV